MTTSISRRWRRPARMGFTLIELLVAMAVSIILLLALAQVIASVSGASTSTTGRIEAESEARATFEILARDLESAVRRPGRDWLRSLPDPDSPSGVRDGAADWLFFLAAPLDHDPGTAGNVCVLSYRLADAPLPAGSEPVPSLNRMRIEPAETFDEALAVADLHADFLQAREAASNEGRRFETWLAAGVIGLRIEPLGEDGPLDRDLLALPGPHAELVALEVTLEVLTKGGRQLHGTLPPERLRELHAHRFTRRIPLPATTP